METGLSASPQNQHNPREFDELVSTLAANPGAHSENKTKKILSSLFLTFLKGITNTNTALYFRVNNSAVDKTLAEHPGFAANTAYTANAHDSVAACGNNQTGGPEKSGFSPEDSHDNQPEPLAFSFFKALKSVSSYPEKVWHYFLPAAEAGVLRGKASSPTEEQFKALDSISFNFPAVGELYNRYNEVHPGKRDLAGRLIEKAISSEYNLSVCAKQSWYQVFGLGFNAPTRTGFAHRGKPIISIPLDELAEKGFTAIQIEGSFYSNMLGGLYDQSPDETSYFGVGNEIPITPKELMDLVWKINFPKVYRKVLDDYWRDPGFQEMINLTTFILKAHHHLGYFPQKASDAFYKGMGILENHGGEVKRFLLDIAGYFSTDIMMFRREHELEVYVYDLTGDTPFWAFRDEIDFKNWLISRCASDFERQKIALGFSLADRPNGLFKYGVDYYLAGMGDTNSEPDNWVKYIATSQTPIDETISTAKYLAQKQKEHEYINLQRSTTTHAEIYAQRIKLWVEAFDTVFPNPAAPVFNLGIAIREIAKAKNLEQEEEGIADVIGSLVNIALIATDVVVGRAFGAGEEFASTFTEEDFTAAVRDEVKTIGDDPEQNTVARYLGYKELPPGWNIHNRPAEASALFQPGVEALKIKPSTLTAEEAGPPDNYGLFSATRGAFKGKKFISLAGHAYQVYPDNYPGLFFMKGEGGNEMHFFVDENKKFAFPVEKEAFETETAGDEFRNILESDTKCINKRAPGPSGGTCNIVINAEADKVINDNLRRAKPAAQIEQDLTVYNADRFIFQSKSTGKLYFKYKNVYFRARLSNEEGYDVISVKVDSNKSLKKFLLRQSPGKYIDFYLAEKPSMPGKKILCQKNDLARYKANMDKNVFKLYEQARDGKIDFTGDETKALYAFGGSSSETYRAYQAIASYAGAEKAASVYDYLKGDFLHNIRAFESALQKTHLYKGTVFHGGMINEQLTTLLKTGDIVSYAGSVSTSVEKNIATRFVRYEHGVRQGYQAAMMEMDLKTSGRNIMLYTGRPHEGEVLVQPQTLFRVIKKSAGRVSYFTLQEVAKQEVPAGTVVYYLDDYFIPQNIRSAGQETLCSFVKSE